MPRSSKVEECMICGEVPCICFAKPKAAPKPRKRATAKRADSAPSGSEKKAEKAEKTREDRAEKAESNSILDDATPRRSIRDAMKAKASKPQRPTFIPTDDEEPVGEAVERDIPTDDPEFRVAIRNLQSLLHQSEVGRYSAIISAEPTPTERAVVWRQRRNELA